MIIQRFASIVPDAVDPGCYHLSNPLWCMATNSKSASEPTLYICRDCGDGINDPEDTIRCPQCGGRLVNSSVPHDD
ncbi:DUF7129 domain-containing putative zinc-binding protein [Haladaptatus pallidirubidus]|uniref:DUF7129 domain-containing putative zinc-binding protein n=1 Tax=Haladaptatus pallidirubidus TaxID=1008152 RepID=UPI003CD08A31